MSILLRVTGVSSISVTNRVTLVFGKGGEKGVSISGTQMPSVIDSLLEVSVVSGDSATETPVSGIVIVRVTQVEVPLLDHLMVLGWYLVSNSPELVSVRDFKPVLIGSYPEQREVDRETIGKLN